MDTLDSGERHRLENHIWSGSPNSMSVLYVKGKIYQAARFPLKSLHNSGIHIFVKPGIGNYVNPVFMAPFKGRFCSWNCLDTTSVIVNHKHRIILKYFNGFIMILRKTIVFKIFNLNLLPKVPC